MEMSIGTLVTIVLLLSVLILGLFLTRRIMCAGITLTDEIDIRVKSEIKSLFGSDDYGIKCMGEGTEDIRLGDGGRRKIFCVSNLKDSATYSLKVKDVKSLRGVSTTNVQNWILDKDFEGPLSPGDETVVVLVLDIPDDTTETALKIEIEEKNLNTDTTQGHVLYIDVTHVGAVVSAFC